MNVKKLLLSAIASLLTLSAPARTDRVISWGVSSEAGADGTCEITLKGTATEAGWHIYDLEDYGSLGPNGTVVTVGDGVRVIEGPQIVSPVKKEPDEMFGMVIGKCEGTVIIKMRVERESESVTTLPVTVEWQSCNDGSCLPPDECTVVADLTFGSGGASGLLALILEAILWGLAMLLTPCVFPMVPMTISFFLKGSETKSRGRLKAVMYGLFIVLLYTVPICVIIGLTRILGGYSVTADIFNWLSTHWLPNILFFAIFLVFAASFFGAFEINLPSKWVNSSDARSEGKGLGGIFFLALTLVLVSFSCTGPIVGTVLIKSTQGEFWTPMVTMLAFSVAFALPFTILAFFPSLIKALPKSGGWLGSVKVVLGFIEVALAFKFLSTADQTYHWHLLDREVYLAIWIVVFSLLGFYLLGKIRFRHDAKVEYLSVTRLTLSIAVFSFVVYMIPGMWGAPLKGLSGYLPPITTQDFVLRSGEGQTPDNAGVAPEGRKYADFLELPYGIDAFFDYAEAREYAASAGKPLLIDFTGHGCVNCREMESRVWSDPEVLRMLKEDYVICALYADDKTVLPESEWVTTPEGKVLKSLGKINSRFALERFDVNAQPYYAILDPVTEEHKVPSRGYNLDVEEFASFLRKGIE